MAGWAWLTTTVASPEMCAIADSAPAALVVAQTFNLAVACLTHEEATARAWEWLMTAAASPEISVPEGSGGGSSGLDASAAAAAAEVATVNSSTSLAGSPLPRNWCACNAKDPNAGWAQPCRCISCRQVSEPPEMASSAAGAAGLTAQQSRSQDARLPAHSHQTSTASSQTMIRATTAHRHGRYHEGVPRLQRTKHPSRPCSCALRQHL